jgi:peptide/nickel transport system substrate-binding protein
MSSSLALAGTLGQLRPAMGAETIDSITWAMSNIPENLFIPHNWSTDVGEIMSLVQEGPLLFGDKLDMIPGAAVSWTLKDPTTAVYKLRPEATFSDGSKLTTDDFVATVKYHLDPNSASQLSSFYSSVKDVTATGDDEVTITLKAPDAQFPYWAPHMAGYLFKKDQLADTTDLGSPDGLVLGTGPYKVTEFDPTQKVVLEARDDYWGGAPVIKKITLVAIPDAQTRILAVQKGDADGSFNVDISNIEQWKALANASVYTTPSLGSFLITLDESKAPFDDVHVRRAIAYSVDRDGIVNSLLKGNGVALQTINPVEMWTGVLTPDEVKAFYATLPTYGFDLKKAKDELSQSAHASGFDFTMQMSSAQPDMVNSLQTLAQNLKGLGINMTVKEVDANAWLAAYFKHEDLGMQGMNYYPDFPDPAAYPKLFFHSQNAIPQGMNASNFKNKDVDALIDKADQNSDPAVRADALKQMMAIAVDQVAVVPLYSPFSAMVLNNKYQLTGYNAFWYNIPWAMRGFSAKA